MVKSSSKAKSSKRYWWLSLEHCQHIKGWDRSQLNPTYTRRISLLSTPLRLGLGLITMISYSWWGLTITSTPVKPYFKDFDRRLYQLYQGG